MIKLLIRAKVHALLHTVDRRSGINGCGENRDEGMLDDVDTLFDKVENFERSGVGMSSSVNSF